MNKILVTIALVFISNLLYAQSDDEQIRETLQYYFDGTSYNNIPLIKKAFYKEADLFLSNSKDSLWVSSVEAYANLFAKREKGKFNGRTGKILSIDIERDIAFAKIEIDSEKWPNRYVDLTLLKKIDGEWLIVAKTSTWHKKE